MKLSPIRKETGMTLETHCKLTEKGESTTTEHFILNLPMRRSAENFLYYNSAPRQPAPHERRCRQ